MTTVAPTIGCDVPFSRTRPFTDPVACAASGEETNPTRRAVVRTRTILICSSFESACVIPLRLRYCLCSSFRMVRDSLGREHAIVRRRLGAEQIADEVIPR